MNIIIRFHTEKSRKPSHIISPNRHWKLQSNRKYVFAAAIVFALLAISACLPAPPQSNTVLATEQSVPPANRNLIVKIKGIAFHDYNGNGTKEYSEPVLPGVSFELLDKEINQQFKLQTDSYGAYSRSLPASNYQLIIGENFPGYNNQPFRYLYVSKNEARGIDERIYLAISKDMTYDLALMQGFLTLPFSIVTSAYINAVFFDVDRRENFIRDWQGNQETYDQHSGIDYRVPVNTPVIAAAPGLVLSSEYNQQSGHVIAISHGLFISRYGHLSKRNVSAGDKVSRGQQIGFSGASGEWVGKFPHLHFDFNLMILPKIDVYRDITNSETLSFWTIDNKPQYP